MPSLLSSLSALAVLPLAFTAPTLSPRQSSTQFGSGLSLTASSSASFLNGIPLSASGGAFYLGVPTNAPCTLPAPQCSQFSNTTAVIISSLSSQGAMYSQIPQELFIAQNGVFSYAEPGQSAPEDGSAERAPFGAFDFTLTFGPNEGAQNGWFACPLGAPGVLPYQVLARVSSEGAICAAAEDITIQTAVVGERGAYEYE